jgi:hypothetical protein
LPLAWGLLNAACCTTSETGFTFCYSVTLFIINPKNMGTPAEKALVCLGCHGDNGRLDWQNLGYKGDPMQGRMAAGKIEMSVQVA